MTEGQAPTRLGLWQRFRRQGKLTRWLMAMVLLGSLAALGWGLARNWQELIHYPWRIAWGPLAGAWALFGLTLALAIAIWRAILRHFGGVTTWRQDIRIYCTANLANRLPTPLWFVAGRVLLADAVGVRRGVTSLAVLYEWVAGLAGAVIVLLALWPLAPSEGLPAAYGALLAACGAGCAAVLCWPGALGRAVGWLAHRLGRDLSGLPRVRHRHLLAWALAWAAPWIVSGAMFALLVRAVHPTAGAHWAGMVTIWVAAGVVSRLAAFVPGALLLREFALALLLGAYMPSSLAVAVALLTRVWVSVNDLFWFLATVWLGQTRSGHPTSLE